MPNYQKAEYMLGAAKLAQLPEDTGVEIAFAGRSNAGKSSALNTLTRKGLARTSKTPGRTQLINLFAVGDNQRLVDLPGYGYAKVSIKIKQEWQKTLNLYLESRDCLRGLVLVMDIRHPLKEFDCMMLEWCQQANLSVHVLLTKADKLSNSEKSKTLIKVKKYLVEKSLGSAQIFSSPKREGLAILQAKLDDWFIEG